MSFTQIFRARGADGQNGPGVGAGISRGGARKIKIPGIPHIFVILGKKWATWMIKTFFMSSAVCKTKCVESNFI